MDIAKAITIVMLKTDFRGNKGYTLALEALNEAQDDLVNDFNFSYAEKLHIFKDIDPNSGTADLPSDFIEVVWPQERNVYYEDTDGTKHYLSPVFERPYGKIPGTPESNWVKQGQVEVFPAPTSAWLSTHDIYMNYKYYPTEFLDPRENGVSNEQDTIWPRLGEKVIINMAIISILRGQGDYNAAREFKEAVYGTPRRTGMLTRLRGADAGRQGYAKPLVVGGIGSATLKRGLNDYGRKD